jgi:hypothetical protein
VRNFIENDVKVGFGWWEFDLWKSMWKTFGEEGKGMGFAGGIGMWKTLWKSREGKFVEEMGCIVPEEVMGYLGWVWVGGIVLVNKRLNGVVLILYFFS